MYFYYGNSAPPFAVMLLQQLEHGLYYSYRKPCASYRPDVITTARALSYKCFGTYNTSCSKVCILIQLDFGLH